MIDGLYYMYSLMNIIWVYVYWGLFEYLYLFLFGGGWVVFFQGLSQEDYTIGIFSPAPMGVSIIDIRVCTFSIGVNSFVISSIDFRVILCFGAYLLFLPRFYLLRLSGIFLRY